jgi:hypothetical protein
MVDLIGSLPAWVVLLQLATLPIKGLALWKSARLSNRNWFIAILIINDFGLLELYYLYFIANKYTVEVIEK